MMLDMLDKMTDLALALGREDRATFHPDGKLLAVGTLDELKQDIIRVGQNAALDS